MVVSALIALFGLSIIIKLYRDENAPLVWNGGDQSHES